MGVNLNISKDSLEKVDVFLDKLKTKALVNATRKSMNRSISALRTKANKEIRAKRKLKVSEINKRFFRITKAKGSNLSTLEAKLEVSGEAVSLIRFVVGQKEPRDQKGIPVAKRKLVRVEVKPEQKDPKKRLYS